ncbi:helix-turn-helix transcriptional regulator [Agromyces protaetiae]|uniref:Helix-turn-helix transcriptional regulator n=1 Tax=Agromyces protaetiae TaxID=2509455 RepID=A0A4P6F975_9MICO|nr:LuxR family transcriptional regulator [Agromyces protaetiae]QAY72700.1 helix-turn-helix transcriptional regulator [Agromyces protaetiae]
MELVGRSQEIDMLEGMLGNVGTRGAALVLVGEPGVGKTALLDHIGELGRSSGLTVLSAAGVEAERRLPYAGLQRLLRPMRNRLDGLPSPQRRALAAAISAEEPDAPRSYIVALALLNVLAEAAQDAPVVLIADDAHWLDSETNEVLAFLARRIGAEPIVLLAAARAGARCSLVEGQLPTQTLNPLEAEFAESLIDQLPNPPPAWVRRRVLAEAAGNPLALIELPSAATSGGVLPLGSPWLPLTGRLEDAYAARVAALPARTRTVLEVAAIDDATELAEILRVASNVHGTEIGSADLLQAETAHLVVSAPSSVEFRHPLVRSAIYQGLSDERRRELHRELASVLSADSDRRTWHLAAAVSGLDEDVALALDRTAMRARRLGHVETAVGALERAAELSPALDRRADRLLGAADAAVELGRPELVTRLTEAATRIDLDGQQRARLAWIRAAFDDGLGDPVFDAAGLANLAESVGQQGHPDIAIRILWSAALRCFWTEPGAAARARIVEVAERLPVDPLDARLVAILGYAAPVLRSATVVERIERLLDGRPLDPESVRLIGSVAALVGRLDIAVTQSSAAISGLREHGRLQLLARALAAQAWAAAQTAQIEVAVPVAEESSRLAEETGQPYLHALMLATQAKVAALQGNLSQVESFAAEAERIALPVGARNVLASAQHARAIAALGEGDYEQALSRLLRIHQPTSESHQLALKYQTLTDIADAAYHSGRPDSALPVLAEMKRVARLAPSDELLDSIRLAAALLSSDGDTDGRFSAALANDFSHRPFTRARIELAYGEWLRRQRRIADSREYLRSARETFDALGTRPFGERARRELRAAGERSPERQPFVAEILTPQELQVSQMAAEGLTNKEIGARLYLSHRTVGAHLARVYAKLGIASRGQLHSMVR